MASGARSKFGAPTFEPELFQTQVYCTEESTCDILGTFRHPPQWFGARGVAPIPPLLRPCPGTPERGCMTGASPPLPFERWATGTQVLLYNIIGNFRDAGERWNNGVTSPLPFPKGATGADVPFHNRIIGNFMVYQDRLETNFFFGFTTATWEYLVVFRIYPH